MNEINLDKIRCASNNVLLKINVHNDRIILAGNIELYLDTSYSARHTSVSCKVVKVPDHLVFGHDLDVNVSCPYDCEMELRENDIVIVNFLAVWNAFNEHTANYFKIGDETYFFVKYHECYVAKREWTNDEINNFTLLNSDFIYSPDGCPESFFNEQNIIREDGKIFSIIPLCGVVLTEPLPKEIKTDLIIPDYLKRKKKMTMSKAVYVGKPNRQYYRHEYPQDCEIRNGDYVITKTDVDIQLEQDDHATLEGKRIFWAIDRRNIISSVPEIQDMFESAGIAGKIEVKV